MGKSSLKEEALISHQKAIAIALLVAFFLILGYPYSGSIFRRLR